MYTDRLDVLLGAPSSAVVGPLARGPPEGQALLMGLALACAACLCCSFIFLSLLRAANLLPASLLHHTRILTCTHLLLQDSSKAPRSSSSSSSSKDPAAKAECGTPSSAHSREQEACIFCFDEMKPGELLRVVTSCGHKFHAGCLDVWLFDRLKASCPMCGPFRYPSGEGPPLLA
ncbi:zinc finger (C3HC4 RING finger) protein, putative [Eimeria tenella]|uniref:Zinc finger (C3HC4 RING finger) protein, putative n=1 Tax=Eimeria tenella TaxID=5802 RepID=U6KKV6_EIMTE|nr:zinc finger (C3HC4 RING finger) protein, putative [Eimeria tenella]CDJ38554.1 zinc finger (C3HC4 RING finger) protein, putative [Eimeria tenella]|eukprot:XP_013229392.1 zinc finger (C3HC4 RING finger) protein, putative [Eimeria tenella]